MNKKITYIFRKPNTKYFSIENVFFNISNSIGKHAKVDILRLKFSGGNLRTIWLNFKTFKRKENTIYHITGDVNYMALVTGKNTILTIHDVNSALYGSFFKKNYIKLFWFWLPAICVKRITVISNFTKTELEPIIPFAKSKIRIIHNPVDQTLMPHPYIFNTQKPLILFIGTKENKNLDRSFQAIKDLSCSILVIGKLTTSQENLLKELQIEYHNKFNITNEEIVESYKNCDMVCFASNYEGFGMPIIEAQSMGRPVVTSNIGAMREVSNDSACMVDPNDVSSIRKGVLKICNNENYRQQLIKDGLENVKRFQLDFIAQQYLDLYKEVSA